MNCAVKWDLLYDAINLEGSKIKKLDFSNFSFLLSLVIIGYNDGLWIGFKKAEAKLPARDAKMLTSLNLCMISLITPQLASCGLDKEAANELSALLKCAIRLEELMLADNPILTEGAEAILSVTDKLIVLDLRNFVNFC